MTFSEDTLLPISALQHLLFCPRQCALIHLEGAWEENVLTAEGRIAHEKVDTAGSESRGKVRTVFGLALRSLRLGLVGKADVVEISRDDIGRAQAFPVEHKRGRPKQKDCDRVQLCAQAICLEEMLGARVSEGALFYGKTRRREDVPFTGALRKLTEDTSAELHELIKNRTTPQAQYSKKCRSCSLLDICIPKVAAARRSVRAYIETAGTDA